MESKLFYFSGKDGYTHQLEIREDGFLSLKDLSDDRNSCCLHINNEELVKFTEFLSSIKNSL